MSLPPTCPVRDICAQCEYVLLAAALFIGCTLFDAHIAPPAEHQPQVSRAAAAARADAKLQPAATRPAAVTKAKQS